MRKLFRILLLLSVGAAVGTAVTYVYCAYIGGYRLAGLNHLHLQKDGDCAFEAYQRESPEIGIYALKRHIANLDTRGVLGKLPRIPAEERSKDWMQVLAYTRLAKLYAKTAQAAEAENCLVKAEQELPHLKFKGAPKTRKDLQDYVRRSDESGEWLSAPKAPSISSASIPSP